MLITIIAFVIILGILVLAHEFGHFITAKKSGVKVEEFGLGFPPKIWSFKKGETEYSLNLIPLGGFVRLKGEDGSDRNDENSFAHKSLFKRGIILSAGVIMNIMLAVVLLSIGFMVGLPSAVDSQGDRSNISNISVQIVGLEKDSPAERAGIILGDKIKTMNGVDIVSQDQVTEIIQANQEGEIAITLLRATGEIEDVSLNPEIIENFSNGKTLGITIIESGIVKYGFWQSIYVGFTSTFLMLWKIILAFYAIIVKLILGKGPGIEISGPVGVAAMTGKVVDLGYRYVLQFTAVLSLNLAVLNFAPFPALDGGRFLFLIIEKIRRKPIKQSIENIIHNTGFAILMILIVMVTYRDIANNSGIIDKIKNIF